jgi:hypothetical protein
VSVSGVISVNVEFRDSTTLDSVERLKTVALREATEYTTGKVAIISRTARTTEVVFDIIDYRNASGVPVDFSGGLRRVAFSWLGAANDVRDLRVGDDSVLTLRSRNGEVACSTFDGSAVAILQPGSPQGSTGTYTIIMYGE